MLVLILSPFNLTNMEQAQRIAKWINVYERLNYCFSLVKLHEGSVIPNLGEAEKIISEEYIIERLLPYFNIDDDKLSLVAFPKYRYRMLNGQMVNKGNQFYFEKFTTTKDGLLLSLKENQRDNVVDNSPLYFMFVDINGEEKPNRIGRDIFIINIYRDSIKPLGKNKKHARLRINCSTLGNGLYCSEYYLRGGTF